MIALFIFSNILLRNEKLIAMQFSIIDGGNDERYNLSCVEQIKNDKEMINKIRIHIEKYELLKYLQSQNTSLLNKITKIENFDGFKKPLSSNITSGDLFKDWLFDF